MQTSQNWSELNTSSDSDRKLQAFLTCTSDSFAILQLKNTDENSPLWFRSYDDIWRSGHKPELDCYDVIYTRPLDVNPNLNTTLEELYKAFNLDKPEDYLSYSLSISDVIALKINDQISCHYVDRLGFKELQDFLQPEAYLKNAEMAVEDDYGMLDGIINNGTREQSAAQSDLNAENEPVSVLDQLKDASVQQRETRAKPAKSYEMEAL